MPQDASNVITNVDVEVLAKSPLVRAFMQRKLIAWMDESSSFVLPSDLARRAADAFDLYHRDGVTSARALMKVAFEVIDCDRKARRSREREVIISSRRADR